MWGEPGKLNDFWELIGAIRDITFNSAKRAPTFQRSDLLIMTTIASVFEAKNLFLNGKWWPLAVDGFQMLYWKELQILLCFLFCCFDL